MALIFRDRFDRTGSALGSGWTEQPAQTTGPNFPAGPLLSINTCDMSTDGDFAQIDGVAASRFMIATADASAGATEHYVQCWCQVKASNNAGLVLRFQDAANMYFLFPDITGTIVRIHRRRLGVQTLNVATGGNVDAVGNTWNLIQVIMTGNRIRVWLNGQYDTGVPREGPVIDFTDGTPVTGAGLCGIMTSGNNAVGSSGPQWNDFRLNNSDQRGETIYVLSAGTQGYGDGEVDAPLPDIMHGLNCVGTLAGTKVKCTDVGPYTNSASTLRFQIGHAGKFDVAGFIFPTYSDDTGEVLDEGTPNLIIEGMDHATTRTIFRETQGTVEIFQLRTGARGVVFRGLNFDATTRLRAVYQVAALTGDKSYSIDKCLITPGPLGGAAIFAVSAASTAVRCLFSYAAVGSVNLADDIFSFIANSAVRSSLFRMFLVVGDCNHAVNYTQTMPTWSSGDVHDCDHITFHAPGRASTVRSCVAILQPNLIAAGSRLTVQNSITFLAGPSAGTGYGVYFGNTNVPGGTMEEHHNGFDGLSLDDCTGPPGDASTSHIGTTCNIAAADASKDPQFLNAAGTFTWLQSAGAGLNGEGTFAALVVPDLRVGNVTYYKDQADDATALQVLDKGALQDYAVPEPAGAGSGSQPAVVEAVYCVGVTFDPGGNQETDLSGLLQLARPIRLEKDVILRRYRANDVDLEFADVEGLFLEENPASFLLDPVTGEADWFNKRVVVVAQFGNSELVRFDGFLLNVSSSRGVGRMQLANRFQALTDRPVRANSFGRLVSTTRDPGIGPAVDETVANAPAEGTFLGTLAGLFGPPAQVYTVTFVDGGELSEFKISGSVTGFEGSGRLSVPASWQSVTGDLDIDTAVGGDFFFPAGGPARGQTCTFEVVWRPMTVGQTIIQAILEFLLDPLGAGLSVDDLELATFTSLQGTVADQVLPNIELPIVPRLAATEGNVLDAIQIFALHAGTVLFETSQAKLGLSSFMPRIVTTIPILCSSSDLMEAGTDHLQIYNEFMLQRHFDERTEKYTDGEPWPPLGENDSQVKYERRLPAPNALAFRGYDGSNGPWTKAIARALYFRYKDPARIYTVTAKIERLNAELNQVYRIESEGPTFVVATTDPASIAKQITGPLTVDMQLIKDELVTDGQCPSFLQLDNPDMSLDDPCWRLF